jgi:predicted sulfurtransferase
MKFIAHSGNEYEVKYCHTCHCDSISCHDETCDGASCNGMSCEKCSQDFADFNRCLEARYVGEEKAAEITKRHYE